MSERKESLLRTLKLQHEQLEQWEQKRSLHSDPDEKMRCEVKIKDIKALIAENELELRKMRGGKASNNQQQIITTARQLKPIEYSRIGFNADKEYIKNESEDGITAINSLNKVGDEFNADEIKLNDPVIATIKSDGNYERIKPEYEQHTVFPNEPEESEIGNEFRNNVFSFSLKENMSVILAIALAVLVFIFALFNDDNREVSDKMLWGILSVAAIIVVYWNPFKLNLQQGMKFTVAILVLCVYASIFLWKKSINFGSTEKAAGEVVILPLILLAIGSIVVLINEGNKKKSK